MEAIETAKPQKRRYGLDKNREEFEMILNEYFRGSSADSNPVARRLIQGNLSGTPPSPYLVDDPDWQLSPI